MATKEELVIKAAMSILGSRTSALKKKTSAANGRKRRAKSDPKRKIKKNKSVAKANR